MFVKVDALIQVCSVRGRTSRRIRWYLCYVDLLVTVVALSRQDFKENKGDVVCVVYQCSCDVEKVGL